MITADRLRELLRYDQGTGQFTWASRTSPSSRAKVGDLAGTPNNRGYLYIKVFKVTYQAHRLAWLYMTGDWPRNEIDHIDLNRGNNSWSNLRESTRTQNNANRSACANNKCGLKGVDYRRKIKKWRAQIAIGGKKIHLGSFCTPEDAHAAYVAAAEKYFGEFARAA
jgi:hypothetical protein